MYKKLILASVLAFSFNACSVLHDDIDLSKDFKPQTSDFNVEKFWWKNFNDENLNTLVSAVLNNNSDMQVAIKNIEIADAAYKMSRAGLFPSLDLAVNSSKSYPKQTPNGQKHSGNLILSYEIDFFGKTSLKNAQELGKKISVYEAMEIENILALKTVELYFELITLSRNEQILQDYVKTMENTTKLRQSQYQLGVIDESIVLQTREEMVSAKSSLISVQKAMASVKNALLSLSAKTLDDVIYGDINTSDSFITNYTLPSGIPANALSNRPDVAKALDSALRANEMTANARSAYFPKINLTGSLGYASYELNNLLDNPTNSIAGSIVAPLFHFGAIKENVRKTALTRDIAVLNYEKVLKEALLDIKNTLSDYEKTNEALKNYEELLVLEEDIFKINKIRFNAGSIGYFELLDAQRRLLNARLAYNNEKLNKIKAVAKAYKALGLNQ